MYMWICCKEDVVWKFFSGEFGTAGVGTVFSGVLPHSWGVEASLTWFFTSQHMLAIMWLIYPTSQGSTKTVPLWGNNLKGRGGPGKHLHLFHGRSCQKMATSCSWESSRYQYKSLWFHFIILQFMNLWTGNRFYSTSYRISLSFLFKSCWLIALLKGTFFYRVTNGEPPPSPSWHHHTSTNASQSSIW